MPEIRQDVLIDFVVDYAELENALTTLVKTGAIDSNLANSFKQTTTAVKQSSIEVSGLAKTITQVKNSASNMAQKTILSSKEFNAAVKASGKTVNEYIESLKKSAKSEADAAKELDKLKQQVISLKNEIDNLKNKKKEDQVVTVSLRQELRNLTQAIAEAKVNGKDLGVEFEAMRKRAGLLKDAIGDASREIANAGSDTRGIDNVIGSVSAVAGGFAAAQGAAALFGDESEDLQKALLKVNAALALSQGLQQVSNALQKEGSIVKLADATATAFQTAAQRIYTFVTGQATAATVGFKVALASTGIGLFLIAIAALVIALQDTDDGLQAVTNSIKRQNDLLESGAKLIDRQTRLEVARAKAAGKSQSEQDRILATGLQRKRDAFIEENKFNFEQLKGLKKTSEQYLNLTKQIENNKTAIEDLNAEIVVANVEGHQQVIEDAKEANKLREENAKKRLEDLKKAEAERRRIIEKGLQDDLAALQLKLLAVEKNSQAEIDIEKKIIDKKSQLDLNAADLTKNQIELIKKQSLQYQLDLQREFNTKLNTEQLQKRIDNNAAELQELNISNEEKLRLTLENIDATAQIEILAAKGNAAKIADITAKQLSDKNAATKLSLETALEEEIALNTLRTAAGRRALEQLVNDEKKSANERITALKSISAADIAEIDKRWLLNNALHKSNLISQKEYTKNLLKLLNDRKKAVENLNKGVADIEKADLKKKLEGFREIATESIAIAGKVADFFAQLNALATEQEHQRIEGQKRQLRELVEAGAITKKEAEIREKQIEIQERQARQRQAQRDKQAATFKALLAIPQAFLEGLTRGGLILAAIYSALAAAQAALVISRPIPKFSKGKKGSYSGLGEVGESGAELIEKGGRMFLAPKKTMIYLGAQDKVFTSKETRMMLHKTDRVETIKQSASKEIDYDKLGKAIAKNQSGTLINIDRDFISESVANGLQKNNYFNNRYSFKQ